MATKLVIVDTDCGVDDAQALMVALAAPHVHVLAVTCVFGNTRVDNVCQNVLTVLSVCEREGVGRARAPVSRNQSLSISPGNTGRFILQIPVFRGCAGPLVGASSPPTDHFGTDGLGDVIRDKCPRWEERIQREHAVDALIRLVSEHRKQVSDTWVTRTSRAAALWV